MYCQKWMAFVRPAFLVAMVAMFFSPGPATAQSAEKDAIAELRRLIEQQQAQIESQSRTIEELKKRVGVLAKSFDKKETASAKVPEARPGAVSTGGKATVKLYGQVNRGVLFADDGRDQEYYHVDNDNSSTRIGLLAKAKASDDLSIGAKIEVDFESNASDVVSQTSGRNVGSNSFKERHLDVFFLSKTFGKLSVGQGDTASNGTSEFDPRACV